MTTYYSIHAYDQHSHYHHGEDRIEDGKLYATFEQACEVIEKKIQTHIEYFNSWDHEEVFQPPNREEMKQRMGKYLHYYESQAGWLWVISKWEVVEEEKPKKYVYQYFVRNNEQTEMKSSPKYETFDEICDVLDKELRKLHGENWQPRMTREQYKNYMGDDAFAISYDFFKTDTYVLYRTEV